MIKEIKPLSEYEQEILLSEDICFRGYPKGKTKEAIQNLKKELKEKFEKNDWENNTLDIAKNRNKIIKKAFKKHIGELK